MDISSGGYSLAGDPIVYNSLRTLLVITMVYCGNLIAKANRADFWKYAKWIVLVYTIVEGLRWGRGNDYYHYWYDATTADYTKYSEPLYLWWIHIIRALNIPYVITFMIYSCLLITGFSLVVKQFPKSAIWSYLLFEWIITIPAENFIRQYIGVSIILIAYYYYVNSERKNSILNYTLMIIALCTAPLFHFSALVPVLLFFVLVFIPVRPILFSPWIYIGVYCALFFFWDNSYLSNYVIFLSLFDSESLGNYSAYVNNADRWFTDSGVIEDYVAASQISTIMIFLRNLYVLYFGCKFAAINKQFVIVFFFTFVSIIIYEIGGGGNEMFIRFSHWHAVMLPIMLGCIIAYYPFKKVYGRVHLYGMWMSLYFAKLKVLLVN